jgi:hypothetical protein
MIGPGWMPSRPRPLVRVRQCPWRSIRRRRRRGGVPRAAGRHIAADASAPGCNTIDMLFDGHPAELPTATLLSDSHEARHRVIGGHLKHWLADRWVWLRPRTVPMIVAFLGMLAVLGTTRYLSTYACGPQRSAVITGDAPAPRWMSTRVVHIRTSDPSGPGQIHIVPVQPGSSDVTITIEP